MAFHSKDKSKGGGDEFVPLTSDQDGTNLDSLASSTSVTGGVDPSEVEGASSNLMMRAINTEPILSRDTTSEMQEDNVTHLSFLHDEVEKIFESDWRFDNESLTTDPNSRGPGWNKMGRESSKLSLSEFYHVDESEYSRHRRVSYPHIHQPLRSLSNKSLSKTSKSHRKKKKEKKKKKKEKIRSFPSRSAIKSPTIIEEEEDHHMKEVEYYYDSDSSSVSEEEEFEDEFDEEEGARADFKSGEEGGLTTSQSVPFTMNLVPATPSPETEPLPTATDGTTESEPPLSRPQRPDGLATEQVDFYIGADFPSPSVEHPERDFLMTPLLAEKDDPSQILLVVPENQLDSISDPGLIPCSEPLVIPEPWKRELSEQIESSPVDSPIPVDEAQLSNRPAHLTLEGIEEKGRSSPAASQPPSRKASIGGKVKFVVGDDSSYLNFQTQLSEVGAEENQAQEDCDEDKGGSPWKKKRKRKSENRRRGSSEGDMQNSEDHNLLRVPSTEGSQSTRSSMRRRHHHHHEHFKQEDLIMRRQKGSEVRLDETLKKSPTETEEASMLYKADLDEMASHRFEDQRGIRRHKIARSKGALQSIVHITKTYHEKKQRIGKKFDHSPHEVFVELDELHFGGDDLMEWREKARWIKFEEDVEEGADRWGKPHVASLSFHSLLELRRGLERGSLLLDLEASDLTSIIHNVVEDLVIKDLVEEEVKGKLLRTLLLKHKHVSGRSAFLRRNHSFSNLTSLDSSGRRHQQRDKGLLNSLSQSSFGSSIGLSKSPSAVSVPDKKRAKDVKAAAKLEMVKVDVDNNMHAFEEEKDRTLTLSVVGSSPDVTDKQNDGIHIGLTPVEQKKHVQDIMRRIPKGAEASTVLVGQVDFLKKPAMAFVRLSEGRRLENLTEVPLPVRFVFVLLGPEKSGMDYHEVGRSLSTLMSNQQFHDVAYRAESRDDLLRAINSFLDDSIVLPPGDWDHRTLLPITHMARRRALLRKQKKQEMEEKEALIEVKDKDDIPGDPLQRTGCMFGGVVNDIRRRYPHYISDIKDAANGQCIATLFFIFFTCLSPCIAFGGLLSEKTHSMMGVSETMFATSIFGMIFSLFSGQPLLIIGATGPVLVFEESLYKFCAANSLEFLPLRAWIGMWVCAITTLAVALEGSFLVRYVTRFTEEIFAILISLIFIYEVVKKLMHIFDEHPLMETYCHNQTSNDSQLVNSSDWSDYLSGNHSSNTAGNLSGTTIFGQHHKNGNPHETSEISNQPNTALLSLILVFGTFLIAYFLRIFRNSKFLGRSVRRALGDFGVLISLMTMVLLSYIMKATYVQKLDITDPLTPTSSTRGWFINPMGIKQRTPVWLVFAAALPGFLIFILLFMETQITEMILNKKERKLKKGSGYHVDQLILGFLTFLGGLFGLPWLCAATVRTVAHISALSEYSRTHAPGEKPQLLGVKEQRVTNFAVHLLIGLSVGLGPVLREIPVPALFGIFLYLGVSTLSGVQMFERIKLLLMPVKYHPSVSYVTKVPTMQMHLFTLIQLACLIILIVIKSTAAALAFPFLLILLVPLRLKLLVRFFSSSELSHLDKEEEEFPLDEEEDPDFYQQAHMPI